jgi:putative nucleotidyltransferase with HDIG domain
MLGIRTTTLRPEVALGFDVYLLISGKHLLYVKRTDYLERARLDKLRDKNVRQVFIEEADKNAYETYLRSSAEAALENPKLATGERAAIVGAQSVAALESMFTSPESRESYEATRTAAANQVALLLKRPEALEPLLSIALMDRDVYNHSVNVAALSVALAAELGAPVEVCNVLGLGGLLHDIGKASPKTGTAKEEQQQLHPRLGASLLLGKKYVSRDVLDVILMHEERIDGKGYPAGVKKLDQIFQVVGLANMYDRAVTLEGRDPKQVYEQIAALKPPPYDTQLIEGLKAVLIANKIL